MHGDSTTGGKAFGKSKTLPARGTHSQSKVLPCRFPRMRGWLQAEGDPDTGWICTRHDTSTPGMTHPHRNERFSLERAALGMLGSG